MKHKLPTFLVIGAHSSGTSSLWNYLRDHPQVFMPPFKEPGFFVSELGLKRGLDWYNGLFAPASEVLAVGEASTTYTMFPFFGGVPERMNSLIPNAKLIYLLRDPIERMRSSYVQFCSEGSETLDFRHALLYDARYVSMSRYAMQAEQYLRFFDEDQLLFVTTEDLEQRRAQTIAKIFTFIGVDPTHRPSNLDQLHNTMTSKRAMGTLGYWAINNRIPRVVPSARFRRLGRHLLSRAVDPESIAIDTDLRRRMEDALRPDMERLRGWLGPDFEAWGLLS